MTPSGKICWLRYATTSIDTYGIHIKFRFVESFAMLQTPTMSDLFTSEMTGPSNKAYPLKIVCRHPRIKNTWSRVAAIPPDPSISAVGACKILFGKQLGMNHSFSQTLRGIFWGLKFRVSYTREMRISVLFDIGVPPCGKYQIS